MTSVRTPKGKAKSLKKVGPFVVVVVFVIFRRTLHLFDQWRRPPPFHRLGTVTGVVVQSSGGGKSRPCVPWFADPCLQRKLGSALLLRPDWRTHRTCSRRVAF